MQIASELVDHKHIRNKQVCFHPYYSNFVLLYYHLLVSVIVAAVTLKLLLNIYRHQGTLPSTQREVNERGCSLL
jgi:hypothetical protein